MFSANPNELSRFKLDIRKNMARCILSPPKHIELLARTLPHSSNILFRSEKN